VIEKHFTLDSHLPGPDHAASLEPAELRAMVVAIRNVELALGDGVKRPAASETANLDRREPHGSRGRAFHGGESDDETTW
jgi:sialic acid synthase SpsE